MTHFTRRAAQSALLIAAAGMAPLLGAASAHAETPLNIGGKLTGVSTPDATSVTDHVPTSGVVEGAGSKLAPVAGQLVGQGANADSAPAATDARNAPGSQEGAKAPAIPAIPETPQTPTTTGLPQLPTLV